MSSTQYGQMLLKIDNVCLSYGEKVVLRNVNAEVKQILSNQVHGQVVGFLGPSGIGKTQLFRIIAGLNKPTSGTVTVNGGIPVHPGLVGVVSQSYPLFTHRTVLSNLMLACNGAKDSVREYLEEFDLTDRAHSYPVQLSGGQRQRTAILQQILCSNHFLLMDEPFSGLDLLMLEKTAALIQKVASRDGLNTVIVTTHDVTSCCSVSDHIWLMGRDRDAGGNVVPGARIVETYDLVERDLCWHPEIITEPRFLSFVAEVKQRFRTL